MGGRPCGRRVILTQIHKKRARGLGKVGGSNSSNDGEHDAQVGDANDDTGGHGLTRPWGDRLFVCNLDGEKGEAGVKQCCET